MITQPRTVRPIAMRAPLWLCACLAVGCATPVVTTAERLFLLGDERGAIESYAARLEAPSKREALDENLLATAALVGGDLETARKTFIDAGIIMGSFPSSQPGAIIGSEGSKYYLGDPYEGAMNSIYTAVVLLATGDEQNARAALKNGILIDSDSKDEEYRSDIAALFLLEAWLSQRSGQTDLARQDLEQVLVILPGSPLADPETLAAANTLIVIDVGDGPQKVRSGSSGELALFVTPPTEVTGLSVEIGGQPIQPVLGVDVSFQATTRGGRKMDGILRGKAVFKEVAELGGAVLIHDALRKNAIKNDAKVGGQLAVGGGLLLLSALTRAEADVRHWHLLPAYTYIWIGRVEPGLHDIDLRVRGPGGSEISDYHQAWHYVPFSGDSLNVHYFRADPHRGFGHAASGNRSAAERGSP